MSLQVFSAGTSAQIQFTSSISPTTANVFDVNGDLVVSGIAVSNVAGNTYQAPWTLPPRLAYGRYRLASQGGYSYFNVTPRAQETATVGNSYYGRRDIYEFKYGFGSMHVDPRKWDRLGDPLIANWASKASHWLIPTENAYNDRTDTVNLVNAIKAVNPDCKVGTYLYYNKWPNSWTQDLYDGNTSTIGHYAVPLVSGNVSKWTKVWDKIIYNTALDFYIVDELSRANTTELDYIKQKANKIIVKTGDQKLDHPELLITGLALAEYESLQLSGVYTWTEDFDKAGMVGCGYFGYGVDPGEFIFKDAVSTRYSDLEFYTYANEITRRAPKTEITVQHEYLPKMRFSSVVGASAVTPLSDAIFHSGLVPSGCDFYYFGMNPSIATSVPYFRKYGAPGALVGGYIGDLLGHSTAWRRTIGDSQWATYSGLADLWITFSGIDSNNPPHVDYVGNAAETPQHKWYSAGNDGDGNPYEPNRLNSYFGADNVKRSIDNYQQIRAVPTYWSGLGLYLQPTSYPAPGGDNFYDFGSYVVSVSGVNLHWLRREYITGTTYSGTAWCRGDYILWHQTGHTFDNFDLGYFQLSSYGWTLHQWGEAVPLAYERDGFWDRYAAILSGLFRDSDIDYVHVDGPGGGNPGAKYRWNHANINTVQTTRDWDDRAGIPYGNTGELSSSEDDWKYWWKGYYTTLSGFDDSEAYLLDATSAYGGDGLTEANFREYADGSLMEDVVDRQQYTRRDWWSENFPIVQFNGAENKDPDYEYENLGLYWSRGNSGKIHFAYDELPFGNSDWYTIDPGEAWWWVSKYRSKNAPNLVDTEVAKFDPTNFWATYWGWAVALLTDVVSCPGRQTWGTTDAGEEYYKQLYYTKTQIGQPINHAYRSTSVTIRRDFTNGYVEVDDVGLNLRNAEQLKKRIRIVTFDAPRLPRDHQAMCTYFGPVSNDIVQVGPRAIGVNYWVRPYEDSWNDKEAFNQFVSDFRAFNSNAKAGVVLHYETWPESTWESEYDTGQDTFGAKAYPVISGVTRPNWTDYWEFAINQLEADFYLISGVTGPMHADEVAWLSDYKNKDVIVYTESSKYTTHPNIWCNNPSIQEVQQLTLSGIYTWQPNRNIAGYFRTGHIAGDYLQDSHSVYGKQVSGLDSPQGITEYDTDKYTLHNGVITRVSNKPYSNIDDVPGLYAHWDSEAFVITSGDEVTSWLDTSSFKSLTPPTANRPTLVTTSGLTFIRFTKSPATPLSIDATDLRKMPGMSVYAVYRHNTPLNVEGGGSVYPLTHTDQLDRGTFFFTGTSTARVRIVTDGGADYIATSESLTDHHFNVASFHYDSGTSDGKIYWNGIEGETAVGVSGDIGNTDPTTEFPRITLGAYYYDPNQYYSPWAGDFREIMIFSGLLTGSDREAVDNYFFYKYDVIDHSYKDTDIVYKDPYHAIQ